MADVVKRIHHELWTKLKIVGHDEDSIISPAIVRGWMAPDQNVGDNQHNSCRAALRFSGAPRSHGSSWVTDLRSAGDQLSRMTAQLKSSLRALWGSAAASSSDPQPLAENQGRVEGTASASSGGQKSMAVQQWEAQIDSMGCRDLWSAVASTPEAAVALETASNVVQ